MILVDSNVILDIVKQDVNWYEWSFSKLQFYSNESFLIINTIIYTEVSVGFQKIEELNAVLPSDFFKFEEIPVEACFLAGKVFLDYKKKTGTKYSTLPDFYIGAHAAIRGYQILTRDIKRYRTYFPTVKLISPHI